MDSALVLYSVLMVMTTRTLLLYFYPKTDIDECVEGHDCHPLGKCENTIGSYTCSCEGNYNEFNAGDVDSFGNTVTGHTLLYR